MRILAIGDIVGENTLKALERILPELKENYNIDFEIKRFKEETKEDSKLAIDDKIIINACVFEIDENTGKTTHIERIYL